MKKLLTRFSVLMITLAMIGCTEGRGDDVKVIGFVTDVAGLGDLAFNDAVHAGAIRGTEEFGYELLVLESSDIGDYENNIRAVFNDGADAVIIAAIAMTDVVKRLAPEYPDKKFLVFDINIPDLENVSATIFREQEAAFLLGAFAGMVTLTDRVGYIAGIESPLQERARNGFEAGFKTTNSTGQVLSVYAGTFGDPGLGREIADGLYAQGADYIASFAGAVNLGVFQAADAQGPNRWALGAALGQFSLNPQNIVASQVKTIDLAVYTAIAELNDNNFQVGIRSAGIKEGGVDLLFNPNSELVDGLASRAVYDEIIRLRNLIIDGQINIPLTREQLSTFQPQ